MARVESHDAVVLGSGEAGKSIAWHLGSTGQRVVVVEQRSVGGSCPKIACLPSKNFIHSASIAHIVATSEALGTRVTGRMSRGRPRRASGRWSKAWYSRI
jgi:pyruvate/2-oxoglutarate dehydrogenase complex dihydrolipoamide dehydrogenase (E3) component